MDRNIAIDSHDGSFHGHLVVGVSSTESLDALIRKIKTINRVAASRQLVVHAFDGGGPDHKHIGCDGRRAVVVCQKVLNDARNHQATLGKEMLMRRLKNRKIDFDEPNLMRLIKKLGFKTVTDFFAEIADEHLDVARVVEQYGGGFSPHRQTI